MAIVMGKGLFYLIGGGFSFGFIEISWFRKKKKTDIENGEGFLETK
jgi:hypothetical protein